MIFKLLPMLPTSKLPLFWYHVSIHNELAPVSLKMLFFFFLAKLSFFSPPSTHTNPSRFYKSLTFPSSKQSSFTSQLLRLFSPLLLSYFVHSSIATPLSCTGVPHLLIYTLVCMSRFVPTDCKLQEFRNLVFLVFVYCHILICTCGTKEGKRGKRKG